MKTYLKADDKGRLPLKIKDKAYLQEQKELRKQAKLAKRNK